LCNDPKGARCDNYIAHKTIENREHLFHGVGSFRTIHTMFPLRLFQNPKACDQDQKKDVYTA
jgi:hypothetical protein